jgi:signal transduction histidine kinase
MKVEMERARSTAAAIEWLSSGVTPARESIDAATVLDTVLEAVGSEARLQGVKLELSSSVSGYRLNADAALLGRALTGLVQAMLGLSSAGSTLRIDCSGTSVRPALIVSITQQECEIGAAAAERFFDAEFAQHPNGPSGALVLAGVAHVARRHGGRVHARANEGGGCTTTFVIPKPLDH